MHEMPGGQYTNLSEQAESMGLGARWHEIARTYAEVNIALRRHRQGDALQQGRRRHGHVPGHPRHDHAAVRTARRPTTTSPSRNSVVEMFTGSLGEPDGGWPKKLQKIILQRRQAAARPPRRATCRQSISTRPPPTLEKKIGRKPPHDDLLSYLMYPDVFLKFATRAPELTATWTCCPRRSSSTAWRRGEEITVELEPGKTLVIKFLTVGEPHPDGTRTVFFELNGQPREVNVRDRSLRSDGAAPSPRPTPPARPGRRADSRRGLHRRRRAESEGQEGRPPAGDGSHEDAEHRLRAGRRAR